MLLTSHRPDFLVISPPKTGTTWLAANLRCHPQIFVPDIKEVKYFSSLLKWLDLEWYQSHFLAGSDRVKGEASPSYALIPVDRIEHIRHLMPHVKLVFIMRDPIARAWSHAKHTYRFGEANFASGAAEFDSILDSRWRENFTHEWLLANGDYLGQLRRWLSVFPREQFYIGFFESLIQCPQMLLRELFAFLGVVPDIDLASFPVSTKILPGLAGGLSPRLHSDLRRLLGDRTRELASFLEARFGLAMPAEWLSNLELDHRESTVSNIGSRELIDQEPDNLRHSSEAVFRREFDDEFLKGVLEMEERSFSSPRLVLARYKGYQIFLCRGRCYALSQELHSRPELMSESELMHFDACGSCFAAATLAEVKKMLDDRFHCLPAKGNRPSTSPFMSPE
jgi:hypothetical protein